MGKSEKINEKSEHNVHASEILDRISDGFVALDKNWCYTYMNKMAGEIVQRDPDKMIGKNMWEEFPDLVGGSFYKAYEKALREQQFVAIEEYYPPYDKWTVNYIYPSSEGLSVYFRDITKHKKAEEKLKESEETRSLIMNSALDAIICINTEGTIIIWTPQAEKIFEWKEEEVTGKNISEIIIPEKYREAHRQGLAHYVQTGKGTMINKIAEVSALHKNGLEFPVELTITSVKQR